MNNKAKVRRLTWLVVLGKAKVISFKDIKEARVKRAVKEVIKGKGQRGRKRKSATLEADKLEVVDELELELEVARATKEVIIGSGRRG
jgi:hypothetical protein